MNATQAKTMDQSQKRMTFVLTMSLYGLATRFTELIPKFQKVQFTVEDFEAAAGLPENVFATEGFAFLNDLLFSDIFFCLLSPLYLVSKLCGKIEPLLGMSPRTPETAAPLLRWE